VNIYTIGGVVRYLVDPRKRSTLLPRLFRAAVKLFVKKGIEGASIKEIAREAGVSEGALYRHFKSKEDLAYHLFAVHVNDFTLDLAARVARERRFEDKIKAYVSTCFESFEGERDLFTYLILSEHRELDRFPEDFKHPGHVALDLMAEGKKAGVLADLEDGAGASILVGSVIRMCLSRLRGVLAQDLRVQAGDVARALWRGLKK
jgi:AcrR family transcriptional regulator